MKIIKHITILLTLLAFISCKNDKIEIEITREIDNQFGANACDSILLTAKYKDFKESMYCCLDQEEKVKEYITHKVLSDYLYAKLD